VQDTFGKVFNEGTEFQRDGSQFDQLFSRRRQLHIGHLRVDVLHTPGHTPACLTYVIGDAAFVGDTLFMPDFGTARCDFPGGSAEDAVGLDPENPALPDETRIFVGHDYKAPGRDDIRLGNHGGRAEGLQHPCRQRQAAEDFVRCAPNATQLACRG
jgi:glyoxylase-like metal-dependent hydrolase (beta-lactamase superfamily II)